MWSERQIRQHRRAAALLNKIKDEAFAFIAEAPAVSEWQVHKFILSRYKKYGLTVAGGKTIVAFGKNTQHVHYYPSRGKPRYLKGGDLIMIDVWARLREPGAPYADITWMAYCGGNFKFQNSRFNEYRKVFNAVAAARDACLAFVRKRAEGGNLPTGREADSAARDFIAKARYEGKFRHSTGHGLGTSSPHWRGRNISQKNAHALLPGVGYTVEPGVYLPGRFGVRSEMNFYVSRGGEVVVTTPTQKRIVLLQELQARAGGR